MTTTGLDQGQQDGPRKHRELKERERRDYDAVAVHYDRSTTPLTDVFGHRAVELLDVRPGQRVLEVACGSGTLLPTLAERVGPDGSVTGLDQSDEMLALARRRIAEHEMGNVEVVQGDAEVLPGIEDSGYDRVVSVFGFMYLPDPLSAMRRLRAVLVPGGRAVVCVWGMPEAVPGLSVPMEAGGRVLAPPPLGRLLATSFGRKLLYRQLLGDKPGGGKSPMSLARPGLLDGLARAAGFEEVARYEPAETFVYDDFEAYWEVLLGTPARLLLDEQPTEKRDRAKAITGELFRRRHTAEDGRLAVPMGAVIVAGSAPGASGGQ